MIKDFIISTEATDEKASKATKVPARKEYSVLEHSGADIVIEKKTIYGNGKETSEYLALIVSQGQYYLKKGAKVTAADKNHLRYFFRDNNDVVEIGDCWLRFLPSGGSEAVNKLSMAIERMQKDVFYREFAKKTYCPENFTNLEEKLQYLDKEEFLGISSKIAGIVGNELLKKVLSVVIEARYCSLQDLSLEGIETRVADVLALTNGFYSYGYGAKGPSGIKTLRKNYGHGGVHDFITTYLSSVSGKVYTERDIRLLDNFSEKLYVLLKDNSSIPLKNFAEYLAYAPDSQGYSNPGGFVNEWADTLALERVCFDGEVPDKYPEYLSSLHQRLSFKAALIKQHVDEEKLSRRAEDLDGNRWENSRYIIKVPATKEDILAEAHDQANCLGGYINAYANGETDLYFLRMKETPNESLVTIEIRDGALRQAYRARNEMPNEDELRAIHDWATEKEFYVPKAWHPMAA